MALQNVSPDILRSVGARATQTPTLWSVVWAVERIAALLVFVLTLPVSVVAGVFIVLLSRRSPLVSHSRLGHRGRELRVLKLRTMWEESCEPWRWRLAEHIKTPLSPNLKQPSDHRITSRFARFLRRFSIDELPQLWQVVCGEMALIGPRPVTFQEMEQYYGSDAGEVLSLKPGITGLWQVRGRSRLSYRRRRRLDLFLVRRWSFRLYVFIICSTVPKVLSGHDAW